MKLPMPNFRRGIAALAATVAVAGLTGCQLDQPTAATQAAPSPAYALAPTPSNAPARGACFTAAEMTAVRERMIQQELAVVALQCLYPNGQRAYEGPYARFLNKFNGDLTENKRVLDQALAKRRINFNAFITEMTNRAGTRSNIDKNFCPAGKQALDWGLSPQATRLSMVPPLLDVSAEMGVRPCAAAAAVPARQ